MDYFIYEHIYGIPVDTIHEELQEDCEVNEMTYGDACKTIDWINRNYPTDKFGRKRFLYVWKKEK